jgi:hypothetical protein
MRFSRHSVGGSGRFSWHSMEGAQDSHGTQWREHKILTALSGGSGRFSWHSMEGAQDSHGTQWREHKILAALGGGSTRFSRHSMKGAQDSRGTRWRQRERIGADVLFYLSMLRYPASANYAALTKPAFLFRTRSRHAPHLQCAVF